MAILDQLASAISTAEGYGASAGNRPTRNNNPGDLTGSGYPGQTGTDAQGFAIFATPAAGKAALNAYLSRNLASVGSGSGPYGSLTPNSTLQDFLNIYADNPDSGYVSAVAQGVGAAPTTTLGQLQGLGAAAPAPIAAPASDADSLLADIGLDSTTSANGLSPVTIAVGVAAIAAALYLVLG